MCQRNDYADNIERKIQFLGDEESTVAQGMVNLLKVRWPLTPVRKYSNDTASCLCTHRPSDPEPATNPQFSLDDGALRSDETSTLPPLTVLHITPR